MLFNKYFQKFVVMLSSLLRGTPQERIQWTFKLYDINKDGLITKNVGVWMCLKSRNDCFW